MHTYLVLIGFYFFLFFTFLRFRDLKEDACGSRFSMLLSRGREGEEREREGKGGEGVQNQAEIRHICTFFCLLCTFCQLFSHFVVEIRVIPLEFDMKPSRKQVKL